MRTLHAAALFFFGLLIVLVTFGMYEYLIGSVSSVTYPNENLLLWIAYGLNTLCLVVAGPIIVASKDDIASIVSVLKGYGLFSMFLIVVVISVPIATVINNTFMTFIADTWANQVFWGFCYFAWIFLLFILPAVYMFFPDFWLDPLKGFTVQGGRF